MTAIKNTILALTLCVLASGASYASEERGQVSADYAAASHAGAEVAFAADFDGAIRIWACNIDGTNLRKLSRTSSVSSSTSELHPAWSPDGRQIAYTSTGGGTSDIWIMQADGGHPFRITSNEARNSQPAWSPDGQKILFVSDKAGKNDVWVMNADGTEQRKLIERDGQQDHPSYSPEGDRIVFAETLGDASTLLIADANGKHVHHLTRGETIKDWDPSWGPKGIVFSSNRDRSSQHWKLWTVQPDGTQLHRFADVPGLSPSALPDGRVVFTDEALDPTAESSIAIVDPVAGRRQLLYVKPPTAKTQR